MLCTSDFTEPFLGTFYFIYSFQIICCVWKESLLSAILIFRYVTISEWKHSVNCKEDAILAQRFFFGVYFCVLEKAVFYGLECSGKLMELSKSSAAADLRTLDSP